jgi:type II secretion system protein G
MKQRVSFGSKNHHLGFTLIELLIVVAIIAILAAIAVPNFLEAQTRSKVSRCMADLRSIATAIESYRVDNSQYPFSSGLNSSTHAVEYQNTEMSAYHKFISPVLTTPVAYINTIPMDPFAVQFPKGEARNYFYVCLRIEKTRNLTPAWPGPGNSFENRLQFLGEWNIWGCGPDQDRTDLGPAAIGGASSTKWYLGYYDASNGTVSNGDIFRSQKHEDL